MRELRLVAVGLTVLAALLAAGMACGGGGGQGETTPTAEQGNQLRQMVLQLEDLPSGVVQAEERFVSNDESAAASEDSKGRLAMLEEWGRIMGYDVTFQSNPETMEQVGLILINSTASLYENEEGASASFADAVQTARTTDWSAYFGGAQEIQVEELANPGWVDEMLWLRVTAKAEAGGQLQQETFANDLVIFRQGPARASLQVGWVMGRGSGDIMDQLAEAQAQHLKDALP
jgi:hypothetical protein